MKLESLNNTERDNKALRGRIDTLEANMKDYNRVYQQNERQKNTIMEYEKKFADYEVEITNLNAEFASWKKDSREKDLEIESLKATQAADEKFIQELQEQIKTSEPEPHSPGSPTGGRRNLTLEEELNQAPDPTPNYLLEISRLKAENQLLKSGSAGNTNATLRIDLEESERKCQRLAENLRKLTEQQAITQKQLEAVLETSSNEKYVSAVDEAMKQGPLKMLMVEFYRDNAIASTRDLARKATEELKATKAKLAETQMSLTAQYRDLLAAQADCTLFPKKYVRYPD
jgi:protein HOOK3